ncbi:MAG: cobalamin-dependent protein [Candidatus Orphnella occulta]|nr:cobalamin-dependent protein [Candidatus Orphnella occulta]
MLKAEKPDVVGAGEKALYHHEAVKVFKLAREIDPRVITVAGGHFFSWMVKESLNEYSIDYVVKFEGEYTFLELLQAVRNKTDISKVRGIANACL